jgi:uncharacterized protein with PIN domain
MDRVRNNSFKQRVRVVSRNFKVRNACKFVLCCKFCNSEVTKVMAESVKWESHGGGERHLIFGREKSIIFRDFRDNTFIHR